MVTIWPEQRAYSSGIPQNHGAGISFRASRCPNLLNDMTFKTIYIQKYLHIYPCILRARKKNLKFHFVNNLKEAEG